MIGVIIPVHNEKLLLENCLRAVLAAARHVEARGEAVRVITSARTDFKAAGGFGATLAALAQAGTGIRPVDQGDT